TKPYRLEEFDAVAPLASRAVGEKTAAAKLRQDAQWGPGPHSGEKKGSRSWKIVLSNAGSSTPNRHTKPEDLISHRRKLLANRKDSFNPENLKRLRLRNWRASSSKFPELSKLNLTLVRGDRLSSSIEAA